MKLARTEMIGFLPARDHRDGIDKFLRRVTRMYIEDDPDPSTGRPKTKHVGDLANLVYWKRTGKGTLGVFSAAVPALWEADKATQSAGARPILDRKITEADDYEFLQEQEQADRLPLTYAGVAPAARPVGDGTDGDKDVSAPKLSTTHGRHVPAGTVGLMTAALADETMAGLFMPAWDGMLVAQHVGHKSDEHPYSVRVVDMMPKDRSPSLSGREIDNEDVAGLHSVWRVHRGPGITASGPDLDRAALVCWNLRGSEGNADTGYGPYTAIGDTGGFTGPDALDTSGTVGREPEKGKTVVNAFTSYQMGGPFHPGHESDVHNQGGTGRPGDPPWNAGHMQLNTLFYESPSFDAPLAFQRRFEPDGVLARTGALTRVHLTLNPRNKHGWAGGAAPGLWEWHTTTPMLTDKPPDDPVPGGESEPVGFRSFRVPTLDPDWRRGDDPYETASVPVDTHFPAIGFRALPYSSGKYDCRYKHETWTEKKLQGWYGTPVTGRIEAWAKETGDWMDFGTADTISRYADNRPCPDTSGICFMPGNIGMEDLAGTGKASKTLYVNALAEKTKYSVGTPDLSTGGVKTGYSMYANSSGDMVFASLNSSSTETSRFILTSAGLIVIGGAKTSVYPALKPSSGTLQIRNGDDSSYSDLTALDIHAGGIASAEAGFVVSDGKMFLFEDPASAAYVGMKGVGTELQIRLADDSGQGNLRTFQLAVDEDATVDGTAYFMGDVHMASLPTSDPGVPGQLWNDSGYVVVSA